MRFKAEIIGQVPRGLSRNDVYASVVSMVGERTTLNSSTHWLVLGGAMAVQVSFEALDVSEAKATLEYARTGVLGWSADIVNLRRSMAHGKE